MRTTEQWREAILAAKTGDRLPRVTKTVFPVLEKAPSGDERKASFVISTAAEDRDGDIIDPNGWQLDAYRANPVILWAHDSKALPIAKSETIEVRDGALRSVAVWPAKGVHPFADTVFDFVQTGFLRGASVGFQPLEAEPRGDGKGLHFKAQELYEYSILPIPSHREALAEAKAAGLDVEPIVKWAESFLEHAEASGLWVPRYQMEKALRLVLPLQITVPGFEPKAVPAVPPPGGDSQTGGHAAAGAGSEEKAFSEDAARGLADKFGDEPGFHTRCVDHMTGKVDDADAFCQWLKTNYGPKGAPAPVSKVIRQEGSKWCLYTHDGSRLLGCHDTKAEAEAQEQAIQAGKHDQGPDPIKKQPDEPVPAAEDEIETLAAKLFPDEPSQDQLPQDQPPEDEPPADEPPPEPTKAGSGSDAVDQAYADLWPQIIEAMKAGDPQAVAEALKTALEAFAGVVLENVGTPAEPPPAESTPPAEPPATPDQQMLAAMADLLAGKGSENADMVFEGLSAADIRDIVSRATKEAADEDRARRAGRLPD